MFPIKNREKKQIYKMIDRFWGVSMFIASIFSMSSSLIMSILFLLISIGFFFLSEVEG